MWSSSTLICFEVPLKPYKILQFIRLQKLHNFSVLCNFQNKDISASQIRTLLVDRLFKKNKIITCKTSEDFQFSILKVIKSQFSNYVIVIF